MNCEKCKKDVKYTRDYNANYVVSCCGKTMMHYSYPKLYRLWNAAKTY